MVIVKTRLLPPGAVAFTAFPFVFVKPNWARSETVINHEAVHYRQQRKWAIYGLGIGLLVWFALYMLFLPVGWNPLRKSAELEALLAEGFPRARAVSMLKSAPYYLWWVR